MAASNTEHTDAREAFLRLREACGLPPGGEIVHRHEVEQVADHLDLDYEGWTKERIIFEVTAAARRYHWTNYDRDWESAKASARDYSYMQSREAEWVAEYAEALNQFEWGG